MFACIYFNILRFVFCTLLCCNSWGCKESDTTEQLNWTEGFSSSIWLSTHKTQRKLCSFEEGKASMESVLMPLSIKNSKRWNLWGCPEDLTSWVMALCFLTLSVTWKHIPALYQVCPWGKRLRELFESTYCHTMVIQKRWRSTGNEPATYLLQKSKMVE